MLEIRDLSIRFGGLQAVKDVSFDVPAGEITALLGPNGAGKTTTFAMIAGFLKPNSGTVKLGGTDITGWKPEDIAEAGMVRTFQVMQPFAGLSVAHNIRVGAFLRHRATRDADAKAREIGTSLGLAPMLDRPANDLTLAGRKRLELARALATEPKLLLLDEVMSGLNPSEINEVVGLIRSVSQGGITILLIEHIMQAVAALADHVHVLAQGRLISSGTPQSIASDPKVIEAYLGHGAAARMTHA